MLHHFILSHDDYLVFCWSEVVVKSLQQVFYKVSVLLKVSKKRFFNKTNFNRGDSLGIEVSGYLIQYASYTQQGSFF